MGLASDVSGDISTGLTKTIRFLFNSAEATEDPTLGKVREAVKEGLLTHLIEIDLIDSSDEEDIQKEIEALVERHGEDVLAHELVRFRASDNLSVIIRAVMRNRDPEQPPTLAIVFDAMTNNDLVAELVGAGEIDPDEDDTLVDEIRQLIDLHGDEAPAEEFLP